MGRGVPGVANRTDDHGSHSVNMAEIVVPDSYSGFVRLLLFLYTGKVSWSARHTLCFSRLKYDNNNSVHQS